ncbi:ethionine resistance protein [Mycoemilia scoparia]|uniref:Ethionine resistance protein n=1 Tax=Mycoemilia scoparia TaxID=417184 RepID=A0A9W7ZY47_9FUNG|nr:ethionine resistance protein [Mycoemilia scoparia]
MSSPSSLSPSSDRASDISCNSNYNTITTPPPTTDPTASPVGSYCSRTPSTSNSTTTSSSDESRYLHIATNASQITLTEQTPLLAPKSPPSEQSLSIDLKSNINNNNVEYITAAPNAAAIVHSATTEPATWPEVRSEFNWIFTSSVSMAATYLLQYSFAFVNILSLGHLGAKELGAATLVFTTSNVITFAPALGYACALDTFCSSAFTASTDKRLVGFHLQRGLFATFIHFLLVFPILWNVEPILLLARQDPETAHLCGQFMKVYIFSTLPWMLFECLKRFIQAQGDMKTSTKLLIFLAPFHVFNNYLFVWSPWFGIGFLGSPVASCVTYWTMLCVLLVYICFSDAREAWGGFDWRFIRGISEFYKIAVPSIAMVCCDWWAFEILSISSSYLGSTALAAQSIIINTISLLYQIPGGISVVIATRVGNMLGAGQAKSARLSARVGLVIAGLYSVISLCIYLFISSWWGKLYTKDGSIVALVTAVLPLAGLSQSFDTMNASNVAILRAMGRQRLGAMISIPPYYVIMFPLGMYLAFKQPFELGIAGLWLGLDIGLCIIIVCQFFYILGYIDWNAEVVHCFKRLKDSGPQGGFDEGSGNVSTTTLVVEALEAGEGSIL